MNEPNFPTFNNVIDIHARSLGEHGGSEGVREPGLVESALASAKNIYHYTGGDLYDVAAGYAFHLAESQAFVDGNKAYSRRRRAGLFGAEWRLHPAGTLGTLYRDD